MRELNPYRYQNRTFACKKECINTLLQEANEIINKIKSNKLENNRMNRNQACWRLNYINHYITEPELRNFQIQCNTTWSELYRLEHKKGDNHPYIRKLRASLLIYS